MAQRASVSRDTISNAERGRHSLQGPTLSKIAHALGRAPSELLAEEERLSPKAESRASLEPSLFNGLEDERRIVIDYAGCRDALNVFCAHWEEALKVDQLTQRSFQDFEAAAKSLSKLMRQFMGAEMAELGPTENGSEPMFYSERSVLWPAIDRFIVLGIQMDRLGKERFGEDSDAEVIELREYAQRKAG